MKQRISNFFYDISDIINLLLCLAFGHAPVAIIGIPVCSRCHNGPDKVEPV